MLLFAVLHRAALPCCFHQVNRTCCVWLRAFVLNVLPFANYLVEGKHKGCIWFAAHCKCMWKGTIQSQYVLVFPKLIPKILFPRSHNSLAYNTLSTSVSRSIFLAFTPPLVSPSPLPPILLLPPSPIYLQSRRYFCGTTPSSPSPSSSSSSSSLTPSPSPSQTGPSYPSSPPLQ